MPLDPKARAALEAVRKASTSLRFAVEKGCDAPRARLSVFYKGAGYVRAPGSDEFRIGLAFDEDPKVLEALRAELEAEERSRAVAAGSVASGS